ncbi:MAG: outer membrane protein assembly factor BamD [Ignavibacteriales bacterium]|nr:outer membrane protein assembly factor BamD [Ignavibacteriales bacterium]
MKYLLLTLPVLFLFGCSGSVDTSQMTAEEQFNYALSLYNDEDYEDAIQQFQSIIFQYPGHALSDDSQFYLAFSYFKKDQYLLSAYEFSRLIKGMPGSEFVSESQYMLAECYYELSPHYHLDQRYTTQAIEEYQAFIDYFPLDPRVADAEAKINTLNNKIAEKKYNTGVIYEKMEYYNAALTYHSEVIENYHDTKFAKLSLYERIKLYVLKKRYKEANRDITRYLNRYPDDGKVGELLNMQNNLSMY